MSDEAAMRAGYSALSVTMSAAVGAVLNMPRATEMSMISARPSHRTTPAAYDAQMPG